MDTDKRDSQLERGGFVVMSESEKKELEVLRSVVRDYAGCGIAQRLHQGWVTRLLKDEVRDRYKTAGLEEFK